MVSQISLTKQLNGLSQPNNIVSQNWEKGPTTVTVVSNQQSKAHLSIIRYRFLFVCFLVYKNCGGKTKICCLRLYLCMSYVYLNVVDIFELFPWIFLILLMQIIYACLLLGYNGLLYLRTQFWQLNLYDSRISLLYQEVQEILQNHHTLHLRNNQRLTR